MSPSLTTRRRWSLSFAFLAHNCRLFRRLFHRRSLPWLIHRSNLWRFATSTCMPMPEGPTFISATAWSLSIALSSTSEPLQLPSGHTNALAESFNAAVKVEWANGTACSTREHARRDVARISNSVTIHNVFTRRSDIQTPQEVYDEYLTGTSRHDIVINQLSGKDEMAESEVPRPTDNCSRQVPSDCRKQRYARPPPALLTESPLVTQMQEIIVFRWKLRRGQLTSTRLPKTHPRLSSHQVTSQWFLSPVPGSAPSRWSPSPVPDSVFRSATRSRSTASGSSWRAETVAVAVTGQRA
jgi:hypothetical protein